MTAHVIHSLVRAAGISTIVTFAWSAEPPPDLAKRVAAREAEMEAERNRYTYRQMVTIQDMDPRGTRQGEYRETRDIIFSPEGARSEKLIGRPTNNLGRLRLTDEDFRDIREVQPLVLSPDQLWLYQTQFRGEEKLNGTDCFVLQISPRQILDTMRLFDGMLWIDQKDYSILKLEGRAVPQQLGKKENLFPRFVTIREQVDGKFWFPKETAGDDVLPFRTGPIRMKLTIRYSEYRRFSAESTIRFETKQP
jgi:hypothetical protein